MRPTMFGAVLFFRPSSPEGGSLCRTLCPENVDNFCRRDGIQRPGQPLKCVCVCTCVRVFVCIRCVNLLRPQEEENGPGGKLAETKISRIWGLGMPFVSSVIYRESFSRSYCGRTISMESSRCIFEAYFELYALSDFGPRKR